MSTKPYKTGVIIGRFQILHKGHEEIINKALEICDGVAVFVGSSQESGTYKNPFTYNYRKEMLKAVFSDKIKIFPLPDLGVGNNPLWGEYVLKTVKENLGCLPDLCVSGKEDRRQSWLSCDEGESIAELFLPKTVRISSTKIKEMLENSRFEELKEYVSPMLWDRFSEMQKIILKSANNKKTDSI